MSHITTFARELNKQQKQCRDIKVPSADATKIKYYGEIMYALNYIDNKRIQAWEVEPTTDKTWEATKAHFVLFYKSTENSKWNVSLAPEGTKVPCQQQQHRHKVFLLNPIHCHFLYWKHVAHGPTKDVLEYTNSLEAVPKTAHNMLPHSPQHKIGRAHV